MHELQKDLSESVAVFMAYVLESVNEISKNYLANEKRTNYTTPKSYLELISLYSKLLTEKTDDHIRRIQRLENGLIRLAQCGHQVDSLKVSYAIYITHYYTLLITYTIRCNSINEPFHESCSINHVHTFILTERFSMFSPTKKQRSKQKAKQLIN